jgi:hypothetical protein
MFDMAKIGKLSSLDLCLQAEEGLLLDMYGRSTDVWKNLLSQFFQSLILQKFELAIQS